MNKKELAEYGIESSNEAIILSSVTGKGATLAKIHMVKELTVIECDKLLKSDTNFNMEQYETAKEAHEAYTVLMLDNETIEKNYQASGKAKETIAPAGTPAFGAASTARTPLTDEQIAERNRADIQFRRDNGIQGQVVNSQGSGTYTPRYDVYIGRTNVNGAANWANPFTFGTDGTPQQCISKFKALLLEQLNGTAGEAFKPILADLHGRTLGMPGARSFYINHGHILLAEAQKAYEELKAEGKLATEATVTASLG